MTHMFEAGGQRVKTWNPVVGCKWACTYCWARRLAETKLKNLEQYKFGFEPQIIPWQLERTPNKGTVFVTSMGDLWGPWVERGIILTVLDAIRKSPNATFYFCTKNPARYHEFAANMPPNVVLGATAESDFDHEVTKAPLAIDRLMEMIRLVEQHPNLKRFISIEPIMDFELDMFVKFLRYVMPAFVYVGYDNYPQRNHLPEPSLAKTQALIAALSEFTEVRPKTLREAGNG